MVTGNPQPCTNSKGNIFPLCSRNNLCTKGEAIALQPYPEVIEDDGLLGLWIDNVGSNTSAQELLKDVIDRWHEQRGLQGYIEILFCQHRLPKNRDNPSQLQGFPSQQLAEIDLNAAPN